VKLALIIVTIFRIKVLKKEKNIKEENKKSCDSGTVCKFFSRKNISLNNAVNYRDLPVI